MKGMAILLLLLLLFPQIAAAQEVTARYVFIPLKAEGQTRPSPLLLTASFSPGKGDLLKGWRLVEVNIVNQTSRRIPLDPSKDRWFVVTAAGENLFFALKPREVIPQAVLDRMSAEVAKKLDYPAEIEPGGETSFLLALKGDVDLNDFKRVVFKSHSLYRTMSIGKPHSGKF